MISCWFCQKIISIRIDAGRALPQWASNHTVHCPACRETYESVTALAQQLSATANDHKKCASPFLHGKIMRSVRSLEKAEPRPGHSRLGWAMALGVTCLLAAGMVWLRHPPQPDQSLSKSVSAPAEVALNVTVPSSAQVEQWTKTLDVPLEQETKLVLGDAAEAINTLAQGFLPQDLLVSSTETAKP